MTRGIQRRSPGQNIQIQPAREAVQDPGPCGKHEMVLRHVPLATCVRGDPSSGLLRAKSSGDLRPVPHGQRGIPVKVGRFLHHLDEMGARISRNASRARWALRMSLASKPGLAGSPWPALTRDRMDNL